MYMLRLVIIMHLCTFVCVYVKVESTAEGEAQRYFDHALTLRNTILFLRYNKELTPDQGPDIPNIGEPSVFYLYLFMFILALLPN